MKTAIEKLHPRRYPNMSSHMGACVAYLLGQHYTNPYFTDMCITSDGIVLAQVVDDVGMNQIIGSYVDFQRNWEQLLNCSGLSKKERLWAEQQFHNLMRY